MFHVKLSPAETHIYTILAERADMTLDEWIQSLPSAELARLEADDPDAYQDIMLSFAKRMLDPSMTSPLTRTAKPENYRICPSCNQSKHARAYPNGAQICLRCTRKSEDPDPPPQEEKQTDPPADETSKECRRCNQVKPVDQFSLIQGVCAACMTVAKAEAKAAMERRRLGEEDEKVIPSA